jgi:class 3 adenylate cyclase
MSSPEERSTDIFICHDSDDFDTAYEFAEALDAAGYSGWNFEDHCIPGTTPYREAIDRVLDECRLVVVLVSAASLKSEQVAEEIVKAHEKHNAFVPILINIEKSDIEDYPVLWRPVFEGQTPIAVPSDGIGGIVPDIVVRLDHESPVTSASTYERALEDQGFGSWVGASKAILALAVTDIVGSTDLQNRLGMENMREVRRAHFEQGRYLTEKHGGFEVKTMGDSLMVAFRTAVEALDFAEEFFQDTGADEVRIRTGVHVGLVDIDKGDAYGPMVNYTARIVAQAEDAEIWASDEVRNQVLQHGSQRHQSLTWISHPNCRLKGFAGRYTLWSVDILQPAPGAIPSALPRAQSEDPLPFLLRKWKLIAAIAATVIIVAAGTLWFLWPKGFGALHISSVPPGATVMLDGDSVDVTPVKLQQILSGKHEIRLIHPECVPFDSTVMVNPDQIARLSGIRLPRAIAAFRVETDPAAAQVTLDGKLIGTTPIEIDSVQCGLHSLRIVKQGHVEQEVSVRVLPPATELRYTLQSGAVLYEGHWVPKTYVDSLKLVRHVAPLTRRLRSAIAALDVRSARSLVAQLRRYSIDRAEPFGARITAAAARTKVISNRSEITAIGVSPDGENLVYGTSDNSVYVWNHGSGTQHMLWNGRGTGRVNSAAITPDGERIGWGSSNLFILLGSIHGGPAPTGWQETNSAFIMVNQDGRFILSKDNANVLRVWSVGSLSGPIEKLPDPIQILPSVASNIVSASVTSDGRYIALGVADGIQLWKLGDGSQSWARPSGGYNILAIATSSDGSRIAAACSDNAVRIRETSTGKLTHTLRGHTAPPTTVRFSQNGRYVISGGRDRSVQVWNARTGKHLHAFRGHRQPVTSVGMIGNSAWVVSGSLDRTIRLWKTSVGR